uniref:Uncharacterized protein n=1 Tax=Rhizophora mucronata TaxID=61149 RepID=A0A2P2NCI0_RHIMU
MALDVKITHLVTLTIPKRLIYYECSV